MKKYEDKALEIMKLKGEYDEELLKNPQIMELSQALDTAKQELKDMIEDELKDDFYSSTTNIHVTKIKAKKIFNTEKFKLEHSDLYKKYCTKNKKAFYKIYL